MKKSHFLPYVLLIFVSFAMWASDSLAYERYNDGCQSCHGAFTDGTSPKGSTIPSDDKHTMHRSSGNMGAACDLCHTTGDGRDPFIGSSNGTGNNPGLGCTGCHGRSQDEGNDDISSGRGAGLRQHHTDAGVADCTDCHRDSDPANYKPVGEQVFPPYYGTSDTNADEPCNPMTQANINENWTIGDFLGLDNDGDGDYDTADQDCVVNQPPTADPNGPYNGTVGEQVAFDGSGSNDPDGTIDAYAWDFGDGNTGTGVSPAHTYGTAGTYTVALTVTDNDGGNDTATTTATISDVPQLAPVADPNGPYTGAVGAPVQFDGSGSNDPDGTIVAYDWDFGDGNTGAGVNPAHNYAAAGTYTVALTVTDNDGLTDTATTTATIADVPPQPPVADPNGPYSGTVGDPVQFDGSGSFDPDGTIVSYLWDFSDGSTGAGQNPIHIYSTAGTYTVALTVTDNDGLTNTATTTATIHNQIEGDVSLEKLQAPKNLKIGKRAVSKKNTAIGEADTKAQDATVTLSWEMVPMGLVNIIVFPDPPRITQAVTPDKGSDRFKFNTDITCNQSATQGTITWTAQIDAPENRDPSNDVVTATSNVTCR